MPLKLTLVIKSPPSTYVNLEVDIWNSCKYPLSPDQQKRLQYLVAHGLDVRIDQLAALASRYFDGTQQSSYWPQRKLTKSFEFVVAAWLLLSMASPRVEKRRLVFSGSMNSRVQSDVSELLGIAYSLLVAQQVFGFPSTKWVSTSKNATFDFETTCRTSGNLFLLEARGRFNAKGVKQAVEQFDKKITTALSNKVPFKAALGVIACPRIHARRGNIDLFVIDPEGEPETSGNFPLERQIILHYYEFFDRQNVPFAPALARVLALDDEAFEAYLSRGDQELISLSARGSIATVGRTSFEYRNRTYRGTYWDASQTEFFKDLFMTDVEFDGLRIYWCIDTEIIDDLARGRVQAILDRPYQTVVFEHDDIILMLYDDGTSIAMGRRDNLAKGMFRDLREPPEHVLTSLPPS